jgi:hypothetical protein
MQIVSHLLLIAIASLTVHAQLRARREVPDAPSAMRDEKWKAHEPERPKTGFWATQNPLGANVALRTNREAWTSKSFLISEAVHVSAISFDVEATHQGLAHHRCVEHGENPHPSRGSLYLSSVPELGVSLLWGWFVSREIWQPMVLPVPVVGSLGHIMAGQKWFANCW